VSRKKTEFHETAGNILGKIEAIKGAGFSLLEVGESPDRDAVDTHLQHGVLRLV
jgi:hypothetical protein